MEQREKLLDRMRSTPFQWRQDDIRRLYELFGFTVGGTNHDVFIHSEYVQLRATVPRHNPVKPCYVRQAVKVVDELKSLQQKQGEEKTNV